MSRRIGFVVVWLALVIAGTGCAENEPETAIDAVGEGGERRAELVTGEPFEATGVVDEVLGRHGFLLFDTLVITPTATDVAKNDRVRVQGEVEAAADLDPNLRRTLSEEVLEAVGDKELLVVASDVAVVGQAR